LQLMSEIVHCSISSGKCRRWMGNKKPRISRRGSKSASMTKFYRARRLEIPGRGPFFETSVAHEFVIICKSWSVAAELSTGARFCTVSDDAPKRVRVCQGCEEKKPGP
jgi:hypothetical protein